MARDAKVRVRLDTRQAKGELRDLTKRGARTATDIGKSAAGFGRRVLGGLGMGVGIGGGLAAVRGAGGSITGETFGAAGGRFVEGIFGTGGPAAEASAKARQDTIGVFGYQAGLTKGSALPSGAASYYQQVYKQHFAEAVGAQKINNDSRFRADALQGGLIGDVRNSAPVQAASSGVRWLGEQLLRSLGAHSPLPIGNPRGR